MAERERAADGGRRGRARGGGDARGDGAAGTGLAAAFHEVPALLVVTRGAEHRCELANDAARVLLGGHGVVGRPLAEALPALDGARLVPRLDAAFATGVPWIGRELPVRVADDDERFLDIACRPLRGADGGCTGLMLHGADVTAQVRARREVERLLAESERANRELERARSRTERLQALTAALAGARTVDDVATIVVAEMVVALGARTGALAMRDADGDDLVLVRHVGFPPAVVARLARQPIASQGPVPACYRTAMPVWIERRDGDDGFDARYPALRPAWDALDVGSAAYVPLVAAGAVVGVISFGFGGPRELADADRAFLLALGQQAALALERARLFAAERDARAEAEAARQRVTFLAEAGARLAASLDVEATLRTVAELAVPALADWCFVDVRDDDGTIRDAVVAHVDPAKIAFAREILRRWPLDPDAPHGTGRVLRTGEPELVPEIPDALLASVARDAEHLRLLRLTGLRSSLSVPLFGADGRAVAVLSLVHAESGRRFGAADLTMAEEVARRASAALASARLYAAKQAALRRVTALQRVTAALSGALTVEQAAAVVVEQGVATLGARAGVVLRAVDHGAALEVVQGVGYPAETLRAWQRVPTDAAVPLAEAARTSAAVFVDSVADWEARYGRLGLLRQLPDTRSWAALPLVAEGRVLGAMGLSFAREGPLPPPERAFAIALAQQCGQALERARLFAAEHAARADAERASRAKSEFLAVMSHELRTPLNAISGYAELLAMGIRGPVTPAQVDDLARIQHSQRHLLGLINEVLNYAKLETGTVRYAIEAVGVAGAVAAVESMILPQARAKALALDVAGCDARTAVRADREKLQQVLVNLLSNAVKFTDPGGAIAVSCESAADARVAIVVRDTGIGIPADKLEAVFEPFVQVGRALSRPSEGTGLGLAISRDLARAMGGELTVASAEGAGSAFTLVLPAA